MPVCVASNGSRAEITLRLRLAKLECFFGDAIFSGLEVSNPSPHRMFISPPRNHLGFRLHAALSSKIVFPASQPGFVQGCQFMVMPHSRLPKSWQKLARFLLQPCLN